MEEGEAGELIPSDPAFWDHFYGPEGEAGGEAFEWYLAFEHARQCYERFLSADSLVLQVGCGTSTLAHDLLSCNLARHVVSIDTCAPAIDQMQAQSASDHQQQQRSTKKPTGRGRGKRKGGGRSATAANSVTTSASDDADVAQGIPLTIGGTDVTLQPNGASYYLMDACALDFPAASFDAVVDKGTLDAMLSIDGDVAQSCCWKMLEEIARVLKPDGRYLVISGPKITGEADWMADVFHKCGLWDMDNAIHSPVQVPLNTGPRGEGEAAAATKEYFITCSFWALTVKS